MQTQTNYTRSLNIPQVGEITRILNVSKFKPNGFSARNIKCPFHDDEHPSASLHREKGLYCHAEGQWYSWKKLAKQLGVAWNYKPVTSDKPRNSILTPEQAEFVRILQTALILRGARPELAVSE